MDNRLSTADTLVRMFCERVAADGDRPALRVRRDGAFISLTWNELARDVRRAAAALVSLGVTPGDRVIQVSENRYEWIVVDLAILLARAVHVPVHATLTGPQIAWQIADSGAAVVLVSGPAQAEKLGPHLEHLPSVTHVVAFDACDDLNWDSDVPLLSELTQAAGESAGLAIERKASDEIKAGDLATILYTSGTTGEPKGVMLSHNNLASNAQATVEAFDLQPGDLRLSWLPLSHIFARTCDFYAWIAAGAELALAESRETVIANCGELRPTLINGVPYFFDKVKKALVDAGVADKPRSLVDLLGGRMRLCCSGGAALPNHIAEFYIERGVLLIQGYGLTECSPVMTMNTERRHKQGTVGRPPSGIEVRIADDGEVLTRGPHVMLGYWKRPDATADAIKEGWLHSGDLGSVDSEGFLSITGRKKELIVTSGGKNIAPVFLESLLTADPLIQQALVIGDGRNYLTALIVVNAEPLAEELRRQGIAHGASADSLRDPRVIELYRQRINQRLTEVSEQEQVRKFKLLEQPFTLERDELTPTLKLRRSVIAEHYAGAINAMYGS